MADRPARACPTGGRRRRRARRRARASLDAVRAAPSEPATPARAAAAKRAPRPHRWRYRGPLAVVLAGALGLRLWGIKQGLPFAYNTDENSHFVPYAIGMFVYGFRPGTLTSPYFVNPPGLTYILHFVFALWFGGRAGVAHRFAVDPTSVFVVARVTVALLGTLSVWLLYLAGARLFDRRVGLLAAALMAVAFLPVFYAHQALNDARDAGAGRARAVGRRRRAARRPLARTTSSPASASAWRARSSTPAASSCVPICCAARRAVASRAARRRRGTGRTVLRRARRARGLPCRQPVLAARLQRVQVRHRAPVDRQRGGRRQARRARRRAASPTTCGRSPGASAGCRRWPPSAAAVALWWDRPRRRLILVLALAPLLFLAFMGLQGRYFGRWLLPVFPMVCLLAAYFAVRDGDAGLAPPAAAAPDGARASPRCCCSARALVYSIHSGLILSRADTRNEARAWMVAHIPAGTHIVLEPIVPDAWVTDPGHPLAVTIERCSLGQVPVAALGHRLRVARIDVAEQPSGQHRGLRAHAQPGAHPLLRAAGLLLGGDRLRPGRPRRGRSDGGAERDRLLRRARARGAASSTGPRPTTPGRRRSPSTSTGRSTTTTSPTRARARSSRSTGSTVDAAGRAPPAERRRRCAGSRSLPALRGYPQLAPWPPPPSPIASISSARLSWRDAASDA